CDKRKGSDTLGLKSEGSGPVFTCEPGKMDGQPRAIGGLYSVSNWYSADLKVRGNVVNPMEPFRGNSGQREDGIKSERRPVIGRIALRALGYSERRLTYTDGLRLQEREGLEEQSRGEYR
ncbi:MAG: hypothetical protein LBB98_11645, partial [Treponema sp.]|nr:hypothetical protein [Treponema sp.]